MSEQPENEQESQNTDAENNSNIEVVGSEGQPQIKVPTMRVRIELPQTKPIVSYTLIGLTVLVYLMQRGSVLLFNGDDYPLFLGAKINELIAYGQYWRLITPVLLHGSVLHIGVNMYSLYVLGPGLERHYGHWKFLWIYLISGLGGVVASYFFTTGVSIGASTAIFGLLGAYGVFLYQNRNIFRGASDSMNSVLRILAINLLIGLSPGIDNWGHIGGLLAGAALGWMGGPRYKLVDKPGGDGLMLGNQVPDREILISGVALIVALIILVIFIP